MKEEESVMDKELQKSNMHKPDKEEIQTSPSTANRNVTDAFRKAALQYARQEKRNKQ